MAHHRFLEQVRNEVPQLAAIPSSAGFMACPVAVQQWIGGATAWQERLLALALAEARVVVRPSIIERLSACLEN